MWACGLEEALLDADADALDECVVLVFLGAVLRLEVHAEEPAEGLPEACAESAHECLDDAVGVLIGLAVDEFNHDFALILGELLHDGFVLGIELFLKLFEIGVLLLLGLEGLQVLVGFLEGAVDEFCVGQSLFHIAHGFPVEFLVLLVAEALVRVNDDGIHHNPHGGVAGERVDVVVHAMIDAPDGRELTLVDGERLLAPSHR